MAVPSPFRIEVLYCISEPLSIAELQRFCVAQGLGGVISVMRVDSGDYRLAGRRVSACVSYSGHDYQEAVAYADSLPEHDFSASGHGTRVAYALGYVAGQIEGHIATQIAFNKETDQ